MGAVITDKAKLNAGMAATANAIRAKTGDSAPIPWDYENGTGFKAAVEAIPTGAQPVLEPLTITENGIYTPPEGVDGFSMVIAGVTVRSPRCDQVVTFDWGTEQTYMAWMDGTPEPRPEPEPGPEPTPDPPTPGGSSWTNGTDEQVAALLDAAAAGTIDLQQDAGWRVGDVRTIHLPNIYGETTGVIPAQDIRIVISSFSEYNGCGNTMQFDFADCLSVLCQMDNTAELSGGYGETTAYSDLLPRLVRSLPVWLRSRLKTFSVLATSPIGEGVETQQELVTVPGNQLAIRALYEVFPQTVPYGYSEGPMTALYMSAENRIKKAGLSGNATRWWLRSREGSYYFWTSQANGDPSYTAPSVRLGIAPFGCLGEASSWTTGTDAEVAALIDAAQAGTIDLQRDAGWKVGDIRKVRINAFTGGGNTAHVAQDVYIAISSFEEYMGCGNILQFDFACCLAESQRAFSEANLVATAGGYEDSEMHITTLPAMVEALPAWLKSRLRKFHVLAGSGYPYEDVFSVGNNRLALRSEDEIFGETTYSQNTEGVQIPYYAIKINREKAYGINGEIASVADGAYWIERSMAQDSCCCNVSYDGYPQRQLADRPAGLAPFGCLGGLLPGPSVSFATGTDAEIAAALDAASQGLIELQNGENAWHVGDRRLIHIDGFSVDNEYVNDQPAEDAYIVITSFDEYMGCGNLLQFDFEDCLSVAQKIDETPWTEGGYGAMLIKQVTLPALVEAMPSWIKTRLKTFTVMSGAGVPDIQEVTRVTGNKLALRSEVELFGETLVSAAGEGRHVSYYNSDTRRAKRFGNNGQYTVWWVRSPYAIQEVSTGSMWDLVRSDGEYCARQNLTFDFGISPFGCL